MANAIKTYKQKVDKRRDDLEDVAREAMFTDCGCKKMCLGKEYVSRVESSSNS